MHTTRVFPAAFLMLAASAVVAACHVQPPSDDNSGSADSGAAAAPAVSSAPPAMTAMRPPPPAKPQIPAPEDVAAPPAGATKTASGLASKVITPGTGKDHPTAADRVKVNYTGWTKDGKMFDTSSGGDPITFGLGQVIPGWTEGVQLMVEGEKRRFWIPAKLAYGDPPKMPGAPAGDLTFDVELLDIVQAVKPPPAPADVKAPPATATKTASGLSYKLLSAGKGAPDHPPPTSRATVNYTGWTTDGKMFDSSLPRGEPATFAVNHVIPGWTEGLQLMKVGDKMRFWIPANLAYGEKPTRPGAPAGMLVFDVELISFK